MNLLKKRNDGVIARSVGVNTFNTKILPSSVERDNVLISASVWNKGIELNAISFARTGQKT